MNQNLENSLLEIIAKEVDGITFSEIFLKLFQLSDTITKTELSQYLEKLVSIHAIIRIEKKSKLIDSKQANDRYFIDEIGNKILKLGDYDKYIKFIKEKRSINIKMLERDWHELEKKRLNFKKTFILKDFEAEEYLENIENFNCGGVLRPSSEYLEDLTNILFQFIQIHIPDSITYNDINTFINRLSPSDSLPPIYYIDKLVNQNLIYLENNNTHSYSFTVKGYEVLYDGGYKKFVEKKTKIEKYEEIKLKNELKFIYASRMLIPVQKRSTYVNMIIASLTFLVLLFTTLKSCNESNQNIANEKKIDALQTEIQKLKIQQAK